MECWSTGVLGEGEVTKAIVSIIPYSITPLLHYSNDILSANSGSQCNIADKLKDQS